MRAALLLLAALASPPDDLHAAFDAVKSAQEEVEAAYQAKDEARLRSFQSALRTRQVRFKALFAAADWGAIDAEKDRDLLGGGLLTAGRDALDRGDGKTAVRAFEMILARLGKEPFALSVGLRLLPDALVAAGEPAKAAARWEAYAADPDRGIAGMGNLLLGDLRCAEGDLAAARAAWKRAADAEVADPNKDRAAGPKEEAIRRMDFVGKTAPEIDAKTWLGGEAVPLSRHLGKVIVLEFFSTANPFSREMLPPLDALYAAERERGLLVLGVTHPYPDGFLPRPGTKEPAVDGDEVKDIPEAAYSAHLRRFRDGIGASFPFVLGKQEDFDDFGVKVVPARIVLDRRGAIAFLRTGGGDDVLFRLAVKRLLEGK